MGEIGVGESSDKVTTINHTQVATRSIESYNVYIGIAPDFTPEDVVATVSTNYYTHEEELEENEVYYWMIEAVDNDGGGTISDTWSFTINSENLPPSLFALISPDSGVILNTQEVNFEWEASVDMDPMDGVHYSIDIHSDTTHIHFETESTSIASGNLMDNSIYHWGVRAFDMYGGMTENIGGPDMFVINVANDAPSAASLVAPLDGSIQTNLSPNFFWTRSFDPDPMDHVSYSMDVWAVGGTESQSISTDSNGVTIDFALMDNSMYGFQVIAFDIDDGESQSDTSHFYTDAFPEPPLNFTTVSPQNESQGLATEVEFKWNMTQDPDPVDDIHYQLVYATNWDDSSTYVYSALVQDTSLTLTLEDDNQYFWLVEARDTDEFVVGSNNNTPMTLVVGTLGIDGHQIPEVFALHQNYPNPFNPTTTIRYDLPEPTQVRIHIVDIIGRKVSTIVNEHQNPGFKSVVWDALDEFGSPVGAGMYFYIIEAGEFQQTRKMILLK